MNLEPGPLSCEFGHAKKNKDVTLFTSTAASHTAAVSPCCFQPLLRLWMRSMSTIRAEIITEMRGADLFSN